VAGAPGLNIMIDPQVKVAGDGSGNWGGEKKGNVDITAAVTGKVGVGISGGVPNIVEAYITGGPSITGAFHYTRTAHAEPAAALPAPALPAPAATKALPEKAGASDTAGTGAAAKVPWTLVGTANFKAGAEVGIKVLGGMINPSYDLGSIDMCTITGVYFDQSGFQRSKLGFEWGPQITQVLNFFQSQWEPAKRLMHKAETKIDGGKVRVAKAMSKGKRNVKLMFTDPKMLVEKAKQKFGNRADQVEHGIDAIEVVHEG
jgi:hypothetical protein